MLSFYNIFMKTNISDLINEIKSDFKSPFNRQGRPSGSGKVPKLVCMMTGKERITNMEYLNKKAESLGVEVDDIVNCYISKTPLSLLRKKVKEEPNNKVTEEIVNSVFTSSNKKAPEVEKVERALYMNGKGFVKKGDPF